MQTIDFCYWLRGYFELSNSNRLDEKQVEEIKKHLDLVFGKPIVVGDLDGVGLIRTETGSGGETLIC